MTCGIYAGHSSCLAPVSFDVQLSDPTLHPGPLQWEVTAVEEKDGGRHFTVEVTNGGTMVMRADKNKPGAVSMSGQNGRAIDPPYQLVAPDMKEGDKWEYNDPAPKTRTVGKAEKITVPAGTFTAVPVTIRSVRPGGAADVVSWYADGVGMVRQDTGGRPTLLLKAATGGKDGK